MISRDHSAITLGIDAICLGALLVMAPSPAIAVECELDQFAAMRLAYSSAPVEATANYQLSTSLSEGSWEVRMVALTGEPIEWSVELDCNTGKVLKMTAAMPIQPVAPPGNGKVEPKVEPRSDCQATEQLEPVASCDANQQAILAARVKVMGLASRLHDHVQLTEAQLETTKVEPAEDGGWYVTLESGACKYIVYSNPGVEIDVAGMSDGCIAE